MKVLLNIILVFLLASCSPKAQYDAEQRSDKSPILTGNFTAMVAGKTYDVAITCNNFDDESFTFKSDETDVEDSNGDGLVISGSQHGRGFAFVIMEKNSNGITQYSTTPTTSDWVKKGNTMNGTARLVLGLSNTDFIEGVSFEISCR